MMDILQIGIRAVLTFCFLILVTRIAGKRMLSQMTNDQFAGAITLGSIAGNTIFNLKIRLLYFAVSFFVFAAIVYVVSVLDLRSRRIRRWLEGESTILIEDGRILEDNMRREKYSLEDLKRGLRSKDVFDIEEVEHAVLETDGTLSVLKKEPYRYITRREVGISSWHDRQLPVELIVEGKVMKEHLRRYGLTEEWLHRELQVRRYVLSQVFYAVMGTNGRLYIDLYER